MNRAHRRTAGFTLVEMLIVVALVGILGAVAVPSYRDHVTRGFRSEARSTLVAAGLWMERNQAATFRYNADPSGATINTATLTALGWGQTPTSGTARYAIAFASGPTANAYVITATPQGGQVAADAACGGPLAIDHIGQRGVWSGGSLKVDEASEACWRR